MSDAANMCIPKVTVVIVNWNGEKFIERCLSALMNQTALPDEIILLDNASSDNSVRIIQRFPAVKLIEFNENLGFAKGNNQAIRAASPTSEWVALLNPDAFVDPYWLENLLDATMSNPTYDAFGSQLISASNPLVLDGAGDTYHMSGLVWRKGHGLPVKVATKPDEIFSPCAAAALYRKSVFSELGGFDEEYFCYVEDVDFGFRLRLAGYSSLYVPESIAYHMGSASSGGQHSDFCVYYGHRNLVWTFVKNMPGLLFWVLLPFHFAVNILTVFMFMMRGRSKVILRSKWDAIKGLRLMWKKRKVIQNNRKVSIMEIWKLVDKSLLRK
jgi:GT2 family glycosyltransferase